MALEHTVYDMISEERLREISRYEALDITCDRFRDPVSWRDLKDVLIYHPNPVARHEASFVIGELQIEDLIPWLYSVLKFDRSIVAKHEAAEALGRTRGTQAKRIYRLLNRFTDPDFRFDPEVYHPDVQATIKLAINELKKYLKNQGKRKRNNGR